MCSWGMNVARFAYHYIVLIMFSNLIYPIERHFFFHIFNFDIIFILLDPLNGGLFIINKCVCVEWLPNFVRKQTKELKIRSSEGQGQYECGCGERGGQAV